MGMKRWEANGFPGLSLEWSKIRLAGDAEKASLATSYIHPDEGNTKKIAQMIISKPVWGLDQLNWHVIRYNMRFLAKTIACYALEVQNWGLQEMGREKQGEGFPIPVNPTCQV